MKLNFQLQELDGRVSPFSGEHGDPRLVVANITIGSVNRIDPTAVINHGVSIGAGCWIGPGVNIGYNVRIADKCEIGSHTAIGRCTIIGESVSIRHGAKIGAHCTIGLNIYISSEVVLEKNVQLAAGSYIGQCSKLREAVCIGAGTKLAGNCEIHPYVEILSDINLIADTVIERTGDVLKIGPIGSRNAVLTAYKSKGVIWLFTGCFTGTLDEFIRKVHITHEGNSHERDYLLACEMINKKFSNDVLHTMS